MCEAGVTGHWVTDGEWFSHARLQGYDGTITFTEDGTELWLGFADPSPSTPSSGVLSVLDTATVAVKFSAHYPLDFGFPFNVFPPKGGLAAGTFTGTVGDNAFQLSKVTGSLSGSSSLSVSKGGAAQYLFSGSPPAVCGGVAFSVSVLDQFDDDHAANHQTLVGVDIATLKQVYSFTLPAFTDAGSLACYK